MGTHLFELQRVDEPDADVHRAVVDQRGIVSTTTPTGPRTDSLAVKPAVGRRHDAGLPVDAQRREVLVRPRQCLERRGRQPSGVEELTERLTQVPDDRARRALLVDRPLYGHRRGTPPR